MSNNNRGVVKVDTTAAIRGLKLAQVNASRAISNSLYIVAQNAVTIARKSIMKGPKSGRLYGAAADVSKVTKGGKGHKAALKRVHRASRRGEAPANDTGNLVRSIFAIAPSGAGAVKVAYLRANADYAKALEYGTRFIRPRPFAEPAAKQAAHKFPAILKAEMKRLGES